MNTEKHNNNLRSRKSLEEKLKIESHLVRDHSMAVLKEFEEIDFCLEKY